MLTLRCVHRDVGTSQHRREPPIVVGHRRHTDADRDDDVELGKFERRVRHRQDLVRDVANIEERRPLDEHGELVPTKAGEHVVVAEHIAHTIGEAHQHFVANVVAEWPNSSRASMSE